MLLRNRKIINSDLDIDNMSSDSEEMDIEGAQNLDKSIENQNKNDSNESISVMFEFLKNSMENFNASMANLDNKIANLDDKIVNSNAELRLEMTNSSEHFNASLANLNSKITNSNAELKLEISNSNAKLSEDLDNKITNSSANLESKITKFSENLRAEITNLDDKITNLDENLRADNETLRVEFNNKITDLGREMEAIKKECHDSRVEMAEKCKNGLVELRTELITVLNKDIVEVREETKDVTEKLDILKVNCNEKFSKVQDKFEVVEDKFKQIETNTENKFIAIQEGTKNKFKEIEGNTEVKLKVVREEIIKIREENERGLYFNGNTVENQVVSLDIQLPKFKEDGSSNPRRFINDLEHYFDIKRIPQSVKLTLFMQTIDDHMVQWIENILQDKNSYEEAKEMFLKKYWNDIEQAKTIKSIYESRYRPWYKKSRAQYFIEFVARNSYLDAPLHEKVLVRILGNHFGAEIARIFVGAKIDTVQRAVEFLDECEEFDVRTQEGNNGFRGNWRQRENQNTDRQDNRNYSQGNNRGFRSNYENRQGNYENRVVYGRFENNERKREEEGRRREENKTEEVSTPGPSKRLN